MSHTYFKQFFAVLVVLSFQMARTDRTILSQEHIDRIMGILHPHADQQAQEEEIRAELEEILYLFAIQAHIREHPGVSFQQIFGPQEQHLEGADWVEYQIIRTARLVGNATIAYIRDNAVSIIATIASII